MLERVGAGIITAFGGVGEVSFFGLRAIREAFRPPYELKEVARQVFEIGWRSLPLIATSGLAIGVVLSMHTRASLERFGAELGAMKVTEQIDALEAVAVDSFKFLAVTRILACVLAMPLLTTITDFCGIVGGFIAETAISGMSWTLYFDRAFSLIEFRDFVPATLKTSVFGMIIGTIACYLGFTTTQGTEGVGQTATRSVVLSSIMIIIVNVVLVRLIFFLFPVTV